MRYRWTSRRLNGRQLSMSQIHYKLISVYRVNWPPRQVETDRSSKWSVHVFLRSFGALQLASIAHGVIYRSDLCLKTSHEDSRFAGSWPINQAYVCRASFGESSSSKAHLFYSPRFMPIYCCRCLLSNTNIENTRVPFIYFNSHCSFFPNFIISCSCFCFYCYFSYRYINY